MDKVYQKQMAATGFDSQNTNFLIADANAHNFGNIITINKNLRKVVGWEYEDEDEKVFRVHRIEELMPDRIRASHGVFLSRFARSGVSGVLNRPQVVFLKKRSGYLTPAEITVKFYYSHTLQFTYLGVINPVLDM
jgi:hypothetical protein